MLKTYADLKAMGIQGQYGKPAGPDDDPTAPWVVCVKAHRRYEIWVADYRNENFVLDVTVHGRLGDILHQRFNAYNFWRGA